MNERKTAIFEHNGDDGCGFPDPKLDVASRGIILAETPIQPFAAAIAKVVDGQSHVGASRSVTCGSGLRFE